MVTRQIQPELVSAATEYPVVTLFGPRQSGKTTLAKMAFPHRKYVSLEDPDVRSSAQGDPRGFLSTIPDGAILDEIQRVPELLSYIQGRVDKKKYKGEFILTGSHQPALHQAVSQSLAGRSAVLTLLPFNHQELLHYHKRWDPFELLVQGCFPRVHEEHLAPHRFFNGYLQTYVERDVRSLINLKDLRRFQQFLSLLAGRIAQVINYSSLANETGVSAITIKNWISVLTASFVMFELPPYHENISKRVIKSPKLYFTDPGLVAFLLGIETADQARRDPLRGALYENLLILEVLKTRLSKGLTPGLYFYRDTNGNEVDLVIRSGRTLIPVEIKSSETFTPDFLKGIQSFRGVVGKRSQSGAILYNGPESYVYRGVSVLNPFRHTMMESLGCGT
jgi:predicted AAA+ superfamily ATPase